VNDRLFVTESSSSTDNDYLSFYIDSAYWEYFGNEAHIAVHSTNEQDLDVTIQVTEVLVDTLFEGNTAKRYQLYKQVYDEFDAGRVSSDERA